MRRFGIALVAAFCVCAWFGVSSALAGTAQTITFPPPAQSPFYTGSALDLTTAATATSGLGVTFTVDAASTADCQVVGNTTLHFNTPGACVVDADQFGNGTYDPAPQVKVSILVVKKPQLITIVPPAVTLIANQSYPPPAAQATSLLPVSWSLDPLSQGCLFVPPMGMLTLQGSGVCILDADQFGDPTWAAAPTAKISLVAGKVANTINFPLFPAPAVVGQSQPLGASSPSMDQIVYTVDPASAGCTLQLNPVPVVLFNSRGTCIVNADDPGNAVFGPAPQVQRTAVVVGGQQQVNFTGVPSQPGVVGSLVGISAATLTNPPGGPAPVFSIDPTSTGCTLLSQSPLGGGATGGTLRFDTPGLCVVNADSPATASLEAAPRAQVKLLIAKQAAVIQFNPANLPNGQPAHPGDAYAPSANVFQVLPPGQQLSSASIVFSIDASSAGACHLTGLTVVFDKIGTCVVDADRPEDTVFAAAPTVQQKIVVAGLSQEIQFTSPPPVTPGHIGDTYQALAASFTLPPTSQATNLAVALTVDAASNGCSMSGTGLVTYGGVGVCIIDANQAGNTVYAAAPQKQLFIPIVGNSNTITFNAPFPAQPAVVGTTDTINASATSGDPVVLSLDPTNAGCTLHDGNQVTYTGPGICVVNANDPGNGSYGPAPQKTMNIQITKLNQTITFTSVPPNPGAQGGLFSVNATASSGLTPIAYSLDGSSVNVCFLVGAQVTFIGPGICTVNADQPGSSVYNAAPTKQQQITVKGSQTITFDSTPPNPGLVGNDYPIVAHSSAPGIVVAFGLDANSAGCTVAGGIVHFTTQGTCIIDATAAGNAVYAPAPMVTQSIQVGKASQTVTFSSAAPSPGRVGQTYTPTATSSAGLVPVTFNLDLGSSGCSINGSTVTFTSVGLCVIVAKQAGDGSYYPTQTFQQVTVAQGQQTITFTTTAPSPGIVGTTYAAAATATSGLTVSLSVQLPQSLGVCTISSNIVTFTGPGTCLVDADQLGDANWASAPFAQQSITVKLPQTIVFDSVAPAQPPVGSQYLVAAHASSSLVPVVFSVSGGACTVSVNVVTFTKGGTCNVNANQPGNATFGPAPQKTQTISLLRPQTITITSLPPVPGIVGKTYRMTGTATSGLALKYTLDGTSTGCSLSAATVTFTGVGTCVVDVNQPGNALWGPAPQKQQSIAVKKPQTISFTTAVPAAHVNGATYTPAATATSGLAVVFTLKVSGACSISGGVISFVAKGACTVYANQPGNNNWAAAPQATQTITVRK